MSDWADDEPVAAPVAAAAAPEAPVADIKLFNKWNCNDVVVNDLSLKDYIAVMPKVWSQLNINSAHSLEEIFSHLRSKGLAICICFQLLSQLIQGPYQGIVYLNQADIARINFGITYSNYTVKGSLSPI